MQENPRRFGTPPPSRPQSHDRPVSYIQLLAQTPIQSLRIKAKKANGKGATEELNSLMRLEDFEYNHKLKQLGDTVRIHFFDPNALNGKIGTIVNIKKKFDDVKYSVRLEDGSIKIFEYYQLVPTNNELFQKRKKQIDKERALHVRNLPTGALSEIGSYLGGRKKTNYKIKRSNKKIKTR